MFAICKLAGLQFSPRSRGIGRLQLYRLGTGTDWRAEYLHAGPLLTQPIHTQLIADHWNDLLRLVGSMKIAKLHASSRQNSLARALQEYGRLVRTFFVSDVSICSRRSRRCCHGRDEMWRHQCESWGSRRLWSLPSRRKSPIAQSPSGRSTSARHRT